MSTRGAALLTLVGNAMGKPIGDTTTAEPIYEPETSNDDLDDE